MSNFEVVESASDRCVAFTDLGLSSSVVERVAREGFVEPTPVQKRVIPLILDGMDVLALAATGTGKTGAFVLPFLEKIDVSVRRPQLLVLVPTRELAQQVSKVFQQFSAPNVRICAVYGGQGMREQLVDLKKGVHIVVGTPGRIMDHVRRSSLKLTEINKVVLDEADEMLNMGFVEDIEWILGHTSSEKQVACFSATMPPAIRKIAHGYLTEHVEVKIASKQSEHVNITEQYWLVSNVNRLDGLTRILEVESPQAVLIFVRTKSATVDLADELVARGFSAAAINGDMAQNAREAMIAKLKKGSIKVLVATDVAARGLDVDRIELVVNYEVPNNLDTYIHRIGRTGRAGRSGKAILFLSRREKRFLTILKKGGRNNIKEMVLPDKNSVHKARVARFKTDFEEFLKSNIDTADIEKVITEIAKACQVTPLKIAAYLCEQAKLFPLSINNDNESNYHQESRRRKTGDVVELPLKDRNSRNSRSRDDKNSRSRDDRFRDKRSRSERDRKDRGGRSSNNRRSPEK
jgi:ATP-dependent RNA helicase DeaD